MLKWVGVWAEASPLDIIVIKFVTNTDFDGGKHRKAVANTTKEPHSLELRQAMLDRYSKARSACLEGRGYTVK
ncbi:hypothetical protein [Desulfopila inferna]|uniref:hypothetical protein n=1 Tax=Desulfopila inferna TaxID=468528 RepID=UPI001964CA36|nr:hypothetical protein [Desulfopila inferna]MBM9604345.1 hypothetical protein [Desulfopila inferna]